ncbi:MAG: methyltransferase domain-containing protein [Chthoniobacteraceae bacterium]
MPRRFNPDEPELMDRPQADSEELERDLENLISLNRWFGSHRLLRHFLRRWWRRDDSYRVLDLCTGAGDLPRIMVDFARARGIQVRIIALDANPATLEIARSRSPGYDEINFVEGNALTYGSPGEFDLVHSALALHHFSEADASRLLQRAALLAKRWVLVSDLERSPVTTAAIWLLTEFIYRDRMTRHDARVSAQRAFSFQEFRALASDAGWLGFGRGRFLFSRQALWLERGAEAPEEDLQAEPCMG